MQVPIEGKNWPPTAVYSDDAAIKPVLLHVLAANFVDQNNSYVNALNYTYNNAYNTKKLVVSGLITE